MDTHRISIFARCHAHNLPENGRKVRLVREASLKCDLNGGYFRVEQFFASELHAPMSDVVTDCSSIKSPETTGDVYSVQSYFVRKGRQGKWTSEAGVDKFEDAA